MNNNSYFLEKCFFPCAGCGFLNWNLFGFSGSVSSNSGISGSISWLSVAGLGSSCAGEALSSLSLSPLVPGGLSESSFLTFDSFWPPSHSLPVTDVKNFFHSTVKRSAISVCDAGQWGVPSHICSDRGHNFVSSEFGTFCKDLGISLNFSSGYHHSANQAELAVCTVKDLKDTFFF